MSEKVLYFNDICEIIRNHMRKTEIYFEDDNKEYKLNQVKDFYQVILKSRLKSSEINSTMATRLKKGKVAVPDIYIVTLSKKSVKNTGEYFAKNIILNADCSLETLIEEIKEHIEYNCRKSQIEEFNKYKNEEFLAAVFIVSLNKNMRPKKQDSDKTKNTFITTTINHQNVEINALSSEPLLEPESIENKSPKLSSRIVKPKCKLTINLDSCSEEEAINFLVERTGDSDTTTAKAIVGWLGCYPLVLELVTAYINTLKINFAEYVKDYDLDVLGRMENYDSLEIVLQNTIEKLTKPSRQVLYCFVFMYPDALALDIIKEDVKNVHPTISDSTNRDLCGFTSDLIGIFTNNSELSKAIKILKQFSLVKKNTNGTLTMEHLIQDVIRENIDDLIYLKFLYRPIRFILKKLYTVNENFEINESIKDVNLTDPYYLTILEYVKNNVKNDMTILDHIEKKFFYFCLDSFNAQRATLQGISENNNETLKLACKDYAKSCRRLIKIHKCNGKKYGYTEEDVLIFLTCHLFLQEIYRRMKVNLILERQSLAYKLYKRAKLFSDPYLPLYGDIIKKAFENYGNLWKEFGYTKEAKECYMSALKTDIDKETLLEKIAECDS